MSVRTDVVNLIINVGGDNAQNQLNQLRKKAADLSAEMKGLNRNTNDYKNKAVELKAVEDTMAGLRKQIGLTALSQKELNSELKRLQGMKNVAIPQSREFNELHKQIEAVRNRLYEVKNGVFGFQATLHKLKEEIGSFGMLAGSYLVFEFIADQIKSIVSNGGRLSDQLADIRKSTGLTDEAVKSLNKSLGLLETRTSTSDLREIAKVGGQLGIAKEDLLSFTEAVDKLNVSLGDEFGGNAEQITNAVGKLRNTFTDIKTDDIGADLMHIGNALNVLGQSGIATAPVVSDLSQRIGSAGQIYGVTSGQTLGLAASIQELGITSERGGTAVVKILQKISTDTASFAEIAHMSLSDFTALVNTDITKALLKVAEGFNSSKGRATEFASKLADAEIGSAGITEVLAKLGSNSAMVAEKINLASNALQNQDSILQEFNIKNQTLGATLDKLGKEFNKLVSGSGVSSFLTTVVNGMLAFIKVLRAIPEWVIANISSIKAFTIALIAFNAVAIAQAIRGWIVSLAIYIFYTNSATVATNLLSAATKILQFAMNAMIGLSAFLIVKIYQEEQAYKKYITTLGTAATALKVNTEIRLKALESVNEEIAKSEVLVKKILEENASRKQQEQALIQLKSQAKGHLDNLTLENIKTAEGTKLLKEYVTQLYAKAEAQAKEELLVDKIKRREELKAKLGLTSTDGNSLANAQSEANKRLGDEGILQGYWNMITGSKSDRQQFNADTRELYGILDDINYLGKEIAKNPGITSVSGGGATGSSSGQTNEQKAAREKAMKELEDFRNELIKLGKELDIAALDGDNQEYARIEQKYSDLLERAGKNAALIIEVEKLHTKELATHYKEREREIHKIVMEGIDIQAEEDEKAKAERMKREKELTSKIETELESRDKADAIAAMKAAGIDPASLKKKEEFEKKREAGKRALASETNNFILTLANAAQARDDKNLNAELKGYEKKRKGFERMLNAKQISQSQYDKNISDLEKEQDERKHMYAVKELNRKKAVGIIQAIINTAIGVTKAFADYAFPYSLIVGGIMAGAGAVEIATIASEEVPEGKQGLIVQGPSHSSGGINMIDNSTGKPIAEIEGGEPVMVLSKNTYGNNKSIIDELIYNSNHRNGAPVAPKWMTSTPMINPNIIPMMERGGVWSSSSSAQSGNGIGNLETLMGAMIEQQRMQTSYMARMPRVLKAKVVLQDIKDADDLMNQVRKDSGLNQ